MAPRKSATKTEARERARRAAAESMAREQRLLELGEEFFVAQGEAEQILVAVSDIAQRLELSAAAVRAFLKNNASEDVATPEDPDSTDVTTASNSELDRETVDA